MSTGVLYAADPASGEGAEFPRGLTTYGDGGVDSIWTILKNRVTQEPFNLVATLMSTIIMLLMFMLFR
jgi:hypothetical protein